MNDRAEWKMTPVPRTVITTTGQEKSSIGYLGEVVVINIENNEMIHFIFQETENVQN